MTAPDDDAWERERLATVAATLDYGSAENAQRICDELTAIPGSPRVELAVARCRYCQRPTQADDTLCGGCDMAFDVGWTAGNRRAGMPLAQLRGALLGWQRRALLAEAERDAAEAASTRGWGAAYGNADWCSLAERERDEAQSQLALAMHWGAESYEDGWRDAENIISRVSHEAADHHLGPAPGVGLALRMQRYAEAARAEITRLRDALGRERMRGALIADVLRYAWQLAEQRIIDAGPVDAWIAAGRPGLPSEEGER